MYLYDKRLKAFFFFIYSKKHCYGYLLESPRQGNTNKYKQYMFLGVLNTVFWNISNYLPHTSNIMQIKITVCFAKMYVQLDFKNL